MLERIYYFAIWKIPKCDFIVEADYATTDIFANIFNHEKTHTD